MAVHNCPSWCQHSIEHIRKNTSSDHKLLVYDNGSTPKTLRIIENMNPDMLIKNDKNISSYYAWNHLMNFVKTKYVAIIHTDCLVSKGWDEKLLKNIQNNPSVVASCAITNYSDTFYLNVSQCRFDDYVKMKPSNKTALKYQDIYYLIEEYYMLDGGLNGFSDKIYSKYKNSFRYLSEIDTHCILFQTKSLQSIDCFDADFYPHKGSEKVLLSKMHSHNMDCVASLGCFVHHHGNATSDGPGMNLQTFVEKNTRLAEKKLGGG